MKRYFILFLLAILCFAPRRALADFSYDDIPTPNVYVVDADNPDNVFFERAGDQRAFPASTTKLMTCILAIEAGNLDDTVTVGAEVTPFTKLSSLMGIVQGETVTMRDLVYGLMLPSGNDAGAAIAVHVAGSEAAFVQMMNDKAASLGMTGTHFTNPHGVHNDNHYSTAHDLATLMAYALKNEEFCKVDQTLTYTVPASNLRSEPLVLTTTNRLMKAVEGDPVETVYPYAIGGKTGDTDMAGKCLVAVAERDGARVIAVLLGDKIGMYANDKVMTNLARFLNAKAIFEHVFETRFVAVSASELGFPTRFDTGVIDAVTEDLVDGKLTMTAQIEGAEIRLCASDAENLRANAASVTAVVEMSADAAAPVRAGQSMGMVRYMLGEETLCTVPLLADFAVREIMGIQSVNPDESVAPVSPDTTPLISSRPRHEWGPRDTLTLMMVLLVALLVILIILFVIAERKRRYERKRRAARARRRKQIERM